VSTSKLIKLIARTGRIAEAAPTAPPASSNLPGAGVLHGSVNVRYVDTGGANDCAMEISAAFGPVYDLERYGVHLVPSTRHADVLLVTGVVTHNMVEPLRRTVEATPHPCFVIAVGDCAINGGPFVGGYGVAGVVSDFVKVDISVPGNPPSPALIVEALRRVSAR
jgi:Ni,Fe-hydrogenase III small subunit